MPLQLQAHLVLPPSCRKSGSRQDPTTLSTYDSLASLTNLWAPPPNNSTTDEYPFSGHSPQVRIRLSIVVSGLLNKSWLAGNHVSLSAQHPTALGPLGDDPLASLCFLNRSSLVLGFGTRQCMCLLGSEPWPLICVWGITEQPVPSQNQSSLKISRPFNLIFFFCLIIEDYT